MSKIVLRDYQKYAIDETLNKLKSQDEVVNCLIVGGGKEQPYNEPVLTPKGWTTMGELKVGDYVIGSNGKPTKVIGIFEQGIKDVYEVKFCDGVGVRCGLEHLWEVYNAYEDKYEILTTDEILNNINNDYYVDLIEPTREDVEEEIKNIQQTYKIFKNEDEAEEFANRYRKLGLYVKIKKIANKYEVNIDMLKKRKKIVSIEKLYYEEKQRCIMVDAKDSLYVTTGYTLTHNTILIAELANILSKKDNVVVLTNISALIPQLANMIKTITNEEPNVIKSGEYNTNKNSNIYLAMEQSFHEKVREQYRHLIGSYVLKDEYNKGFKGKTYGDIKKFLKPKKIIGFTATPHNAKGELFWNKEQLIEPITAKELEERGYWSKIDYIIPRASKLIDVDNMEATSTDFTDISNAREFIKNLEQIVASFREKIEGKKTLIFCSTIEQAEKYANKLKEIGFRVGVVHSNKSQQENKDVIRRFKDELKVLDKDLFNQELKKEEPIDVLVSVTSLSIGFDAPNAEILVNLRATKSLLLYIQMIVGRICRPYEKYNNQKTIIDYGHTVKRFGLGRDYSLKMLLDGYYSKENQEEREKLYEKLMSYEEDDLIIPSMYTYETSLNKAIEYMKKKYGYNIEIEFNSLWYKDGFVKLIVIGSEYYNKKADFISNQDIKMATDGTIKWVLNKLAETDFGKRMKRLKTFFDNVENDTAVELYRNAYERLYKKFFKAFKTRIKNIALQNKKFAGIAFFGDFLLEDNDTRESFEAIERFIDENFIEIVIGNKIEYKKKEKNNIDDFNTIIDDDDDEYYTLDECPF